MSSQEENSRRGDDEVDQGGNIRSIVAEEIGIALEKTIPYMITKIRDDVRVVVQEEVEKAFTGGAGNKENDEHQDENIVNTTEMNKGCSYKDFSSCNPPTFMGEPNPVVSMRWIKEVEGAFVTSKCAEKDKVIYASNLLRDKAKYWWEAIMSVTGSDNAWKMTWAEFKDKYLEHFCPQSAIDRITQEFLTMQQGGKSVDDFTGEFLDKARFCPHYVSIEKLKMDRYLACLNGEIREHVVTSNPPNFEAMVEAARRREWEIYKQNEEGKKKRKDENPQGSYKKQRFDPKGKKPGGIRRFDPTNLKRFDGGSNQKGEIPNCLTCGKKHRGECRLSPSSLAPTGCYNCGMPGYTYSNCPSPFKLCYHCKEPGHMKSDCPKLTQSQKSMSSVKPPLVLEGSSSKKTETSKARGRAF